MNNSDGFEEARRIIAEAQRFRLTGICCSSNNNNGVTGLTGPVGLSQKGKMAHLYFKVCLIRFFFVL